MALIPIYGRFVGDCTALLVAVDTEDTIDEVATKIAAHAVGPRLPEHPGAKGFEVLAGGRTLAARVRPHYASAHGNSYGAALRRNGNI